MVKDSGRGEGRERRRRPSPVGTSVSYNAASDEIRLGLDGGVTLLIPRDLIEELRDAPASHMHDLSLICDGEALASEADDMHIFVPGLVRDLIGEYDLCCIADDSPGRED